MMVGTIPLKSTCAIHHTHLVDLCDESGRPVCAPSLGFQARALASHSGAYHHQDARASGLPGPVHV